MLGIKIMLYSNGMLKYFSSEWCKIRYSLLKASYFARNVDLLSKVKDSITKIEILRIEFDNELEFF